MKNKINATVAILTLNSEDTLERCLRSVKDFAEIIVCDGNSTDNTLKIAKKYGARIVPQFKSRKKNIRITDKADARNTALKMSTRDWHFYLDSDDDISQQLTGEIKKITLLKNPRHFIYAVPLRHVINGKIIHHSSNYPLYQYRLFNTKSGANFIKPVHERIQFNTSLYSVGKLKGYYNIHWSKKRAQDFYQTTILPYVDMETEQIKRFIGPKWYVQWILGYQIPIIIGMIVRIIFQYSRYGFKRSMPINIEASRILGKMLYIIRATGLLIKHIYK